jgi:magnesium-transporting ATPase (P-type)
MVILVVMVIMIIVVTCVHDAKNETSTGKEAKDDPSTKTTAGIFFARFLESINIFVVLIVVAIPEGLQLVLAFSLAFSLGKM